MNNNGYILLYNPISNEGHLDSWHVLFIDLLLKSGFGIIAVSSDPEGLRSKLVLKGVEKSDQLILLDALDQSIKTPSVICLLWRKLNAFWNKLRFRQRKTSLDPMAFFKRVNQIIDKYPEKISLIFNMYVDAYPASAKYWKSLKLKNNLPWMGLCITPSGHPTEGYYTLNSYKGTCLLDEILTNQYQQEMPNRLFDYLPDITETGLLDQQHSLTKEILTLASGRKIVFMGGSIGKQKNLARWYELIELSDKNQWFFVQIGRINKNNLTSEDEIALEKNLKKSPENLFTFSDYIKDERVFNQIISISHAIFAVYRDFGRSSNMLSKSAYFEKPILVSKNCLMGELVNQYKIGLAVNSNDSAEIYNGLLLLDKIDSIKLNFANYRKNFSEFVMQNKLSQFISAGIKS